MPWFVMKYNALDTVRPLTYCLAHMFPIMTSCFLKSPHHWRWLSPKQARAGGLCPAREDPKCVHHEPLALIEMILSDGISKLKCNLMIIQVNPPDATDNKE